MTTDNRMSPKPDFDRREKRWHEIEEKIGRLSLSLQEIEASIHKAEAQGLKPFYGHHEMVANEIIRLSHEQAEIEMFLIENEAPGWTSI